MKAGDRVLEIGCGWGALAEMATTELGASVAGVTLSTEQLALPMTRMQRLGVPLAAAPVRPTCACRTTATSTTGRLTPFAPSKWWRPWAAPTGPPTSRPCSRLLKPGGRACIQSIVIDDALFERYIGSTDFIQQYIFPGGCLPCPREFRRAGRGRRPAGGGGICLWRGLRRDAAPLARALSGRSAREILQQGFDERFMRIWEFYLATAKPLSPWATSTWCSTPWSSHRL